MCNIITFRFTCQHTLRRRRSRCGGTKHKITSNNIKAACIAESFLTIHLQITCDPCQHRAWEEAQKLKLERANAFLDQLRQRSLPGMDIVSKLIKSLEAEYAVATWNTRNRFAYVQKPSVTRVKHSHYKRTASKLRQEVLPEDVVEKAEKKWDEMGEEDYDGDYEASTDPVHPVSTDYSHPLDDDDMNWVRQHLSPEDIEPGITDTIDLQNHSWSWDNNDDSAVISPVADARTKQQEDSGQDPGTVKTRDNSKEDIITRGLGADRTSNESGDITPNQDAGVQQTIKAFWAIVNAQDPLPGKLSPIHTTFSTTSHLHIMDTTTTSEPSTAEELTTPTALSHANLSR